ncbi:type VI secretion system protein VasD [Burkholderia sp. THE68]|uniref:type VI secretion system lipoprotein TssJ n=1 Tax=Burkholderia sp. THE68 TaxID=758782 RepID=UPI001316706A|nr:type VI secretion system lipoprotein TssJ [Burkholderia sp. THE68]BBU30817.1 type VI secretion system protein VasD [Burkholderia sp. THE68]
MFKRGAVTSAFLPVLLGGCGVWQAASDGTANAWHVMTDWRVKVVDVDMSAHADLNPDASGHPGSVAVRVYQLKDRKRFDSASFNDLIRRDQTLLAPDLQTSMATVVNPGASASVSQPMQKETAFIAIAAFYETPNKAGAWKQVIAARKLPDDVPLKLTLADGKLELANEDTKAGKR